MNDETKTELAERPTTELQAFRSTVDKMGDQFAAALPAHVPVDKFKRAVLTAINLNPDLLDADRRTLLASCMRAASDGLLLDNRDAALVIFKTKQDNSWIKAVQYMPMVGGILKRMRQSGDIKDVQTAVVYAGDEFEHWTDETGEHLTHRPNYDESRGNEWLAYAIIRTQDGGVYIEVMDREQIARVRAVSKTGDSEKGPWTNWTAEMWRKTVLRRLAKRAPMSTDVAEMLARDDAENFNLHQLVTEPTRTGTPRTRPAILDQIAAPRSATAEEVDAAEAAANAGGAI